VQRPTKGDLEPLLETLPFNDKLSLDRITQPPWHWDPAKRRQHGRVEKKPSFTFTFTSSKHESTGGLKQMSEP
jgi:hypothetical protein